MRLGLLILAAAAAAALGVPAPAAQAELVVRADSTTSTSTSTTTSTSTSSRTKTSTKTKIKTISSSSSTSTSTSTSTPEATSTTEPPTTTIPSTSAISSTTTSPEPEPQPETPQTSSTDTPPTIGTTTPAPDPAATAPVRGNTITTVLTITAGPSLSGIQNGATIYFPTASIYWVFNALAMVQWAPALNAFVDIRIDNEDRSLLNHTYTLSSQVPPSFTSMSISVVEPCKPGKGYYLTLVDSQNGTVYSQSELFELKPQGTQPIMPPGVSAMTAIMGAQHGVPDGQISGARQAAAWGWAGVVAVGVLVAAGV